MHSAASTSAPRVLLINSVMMGGGVDSHTLTLARALLRTGTRVALALPRHARWTPQAQRIEGLEVLDFDAPRQLWPVLLAWRARRNEPAIVHAHHGRDYWLAVLTAALVPGMRVVVTRHLMMQLKPRARKLLRLGKAEVIAVSDAVLRSLYPLEDLHVTCIRCGIDTRGLHPDAGVRELARKRLEVDEHRCLFTVIGPIHSPDGKGQFYFLDAARELHMRAPHVSFLCVGDGDAVDTLRMRVRDYGLEDVFRIHPFTDDLASLLQATDVLVHPAVGSEALGLVILEALACGKPVIASRLDGISETFIEGVHGRLVPPRDAAALAEAMWDLAQDPAQRAGMGVRGREWVDHEFSLEKLGQEVVNLYKRVLAT